MIPKDDFKEELHNLSPLLQQLKGEKNFNVPKDYFKNLPDTVFARMETRPTSKPKFSFLDYVTNCLGALWQPKLAYSLAFAMGLGVMALAGWGQLHNTATITDVPLTNKNEIIASLSDDEIYHFANKNVHEVDDYSWVDLDASELEKLSPISYFTEDADLIIELTDEY